MPVQFGRSAFISVSEETTYGTESGGSYTDMRLISSSLQKTIERARKTHLNHGTAGFVRSTFDGFNITGGNITGPFHYVVHTQKGTITVVRSLVKVHLLKPPLLIRGSPSKVHYGAIGVSFTEKATRRHANSRGALGHRTTIA